MEVIGNIPSCSCTGSSPLGPAIRPTPSRFSCKVSHLALNFSRLTTWQHQLHVLHSPGAAYAVEPITFSARSRKVAQNTAIDSALPQTNIFGKVDAISLFWLVSRNIELEVIETGSLSRSC